MKQRIAILASGPSLQDYWFPQMINDYEAVIGVNSATFLFKTHWAVCIDAEMVHGHLGLHQINGKFGIKPKIGYVSGKQWRDQLLMTGKQWREFPGRIVGCYWSFVNALFFANSLKRGQDFQIDIFGFDCAIEKADCSGLYGTHDKSRFRRELRWIQAAWHNNIRVFSTISPDILSWLKGTNETLSL